MNGQIKTVRRISFRRILAGLILLLVLAGCGGQTEPGPDAGSNPDIGEKLKITATTGMVADIAKNVGKSHVEVEALMGPGVDPHLYKASQRDIGKLDGADLILYNGLQLEGKMEDIFEKLALRKPVVAVTENIPKEQLIRDTTSDHYDPHVWFDVKLWMNAVERVRDELVKLDPKHRADYEKNAAEYLKELELLDQYVRENLASIDKERRVLVTAHDAFAYFGRAYDMEVMGLQGISTDSEYGLKDIQNLVNVLVERKIKAVFIESSVSKRSIEAVVEGAREKGHSVSIGGELFSDAMGEEETETGTYLGMIRHNVDTIVSGLK